eukprot:PhF_6_TR42141/c0_g1_i1/m.63669
MAGGNSTVTGFRDIYTNGDMVIQNPKETASIFCFVVFITVMLEKGSHYFKEHPSRYVRALCANVSEEITIVGLIALGIMFAATSILQASFVEPRWFLLFEWMHMVLFFMMLLFVVGICVSALYLQTFLEGWARFEATIPADNTVPKTLSWQTHFFYYARIVFYKQIDFTYNGAFKCVPFSAYLKRTARVTVVQFAHLSTSCWVALVFAACVNSTRQYVIPGQLQSKPIENFTLGDRLWNLITFILLIGYVPMVVFLSVVFVLRKRVAEYLRASTEENTKKQMEQNDVMSEVYSDHGSEHGRGKNKVKIEINGKMMWVHPRHLDSKNLMSQETLEDPSQYLLFQSMTGTVNMMQIPIVLTELYLSMFFMGNLYEVVVEIDNYRYLLLPVAFIPVVVCFFVLPHAIMMLTFLSALGSNLNDHVLRSVMVELGVGDHGDTLHIHPNNDGPDEFDEEEIQRAKEAAILEQKKKQHIAETRMQAIRGDILELEGLHALLDSSHDALKRYKKVQLRSDQYKKKVEAKQYAIPLVRLSGAGGWEATDDLKSGERDAIEGTEGTSSVYDGEYPADEETEETESMIELNQMKYSKSRFTPLPKDRNVAKEVDSILQRSKQVLAASQQKRAIAGTMKPKTNQNNAHNDVVVDFMSLVRNTPSWELDKSLRKRNDVRQYL